MEGKTLSGKAIVYGDDVDTDVIIPARYCTSYDPTELGKHCMEDLDPDFTKKVQPGDVIIAGENFGCGSSRENAPLAIKGALVSAIIAKSFARIFFRNSINVGLPILESRDLVCETKEGDTIEIDMDKSTITNKRTGKEYKFPRFPDEVLEIVEAGGMVAYVKRRLGKR
ncbi:MAG: 3-isopropylmalate dehydratase small subunit [Candidatus Glassbacteria bacterium]